MTETDVKVSAEGREYFVRVTHPYVWEALFSVFPMGVFEPADVMPTDPDTEKVLARFIAMHPEHPLGHAWRGVGGELRLPSHTAAQQRGSPLHSRADVLNAWDVPHGDTPEYEDADLKRAMSARLGWPAGHLVRFTPHGMEVTAGSQVATFGFREGVVWEDMLSELASLGKSDAERWLAAAPDQDEILL